MRFWKQLFTLTATIYSSGSNSTDLQSACYYVVTSAQIQCYKFRATEQSNASTNTLQVIETTWASSEILPNRSERNSILEAVNEHQCS